MVHFLVAAISAALVTSTPVLGDHPSIRTSSGNININLPIDSQLLINRGRNVDLSDLENRLNDMEQVSIPDLVAEGEYTAEMKATQATNNAMVGLNAQLDVLEATLRATAASLPSMISTTVATSMISSNNLIDQKVARVNNAIAANASSMASYVSMQTDQLTSRAKAVTPKGVVIGYKECATSRSSGADSAPYDFMSCTYAKKRADTILHIEFNSNGRQINGWSAWRFYVDNTECRGPSNEDQGDIRARWHGSNRDLHRPQTIGGFCYRGSNNRPFGAGNRLVQWRQTNEAGDSYVGWASTSRIRITEYMPNSDSYTTD